MAKFRKKPVVIEAFRLNERGLIAENWFWDAVTRNDIITHCFGKHYPDPAWCEIKTFKGTMIANAGDYIIQGVNGEIYPCKADTFQKTYTEDKPKTNADRLRAMSDEKLALFVRAIISAESCPCIDCDCDECFFKEPCSKGFKWYGKEIEWLQQPFEGE